MFRVIFSVLEAHTEVHSACIAFSMIGAHLLRRHYKLQANAVGGAAAYALGHNFKVLTFGKIEDGCLIAAPDGFHCWIECNGYIIDFLSPLFRDKIAEHDDSAAVPRRVFMKPLSLMSPALPQRSDIEGTFQLVASGERTEKMVQSFYETKRAQDLQAICESWYCRPPKRITPQLAIRDDLYNITHLRLRGPEIAGFW